MNPLSSKRLAFYCYRSILWFLFLSFAVKYGGQAFCPTV